MLERLPIAVILILTSLICYLIAQRPALSKKEEQELKELDNIIATMYGQKK